MAVCLSGGVDSTFVAHVVHSSVPENMQIDLINVAFGNSEKVSFYFNLISNNKSIFYRNVNKHLIVNVPERRWNHFELHTQLANFASFLSTLIAKPSK